jgi:hypothetical protein
VGVEFQQFNKINQNNSAMFYQRCYQEFDCPFAWKNIPISFKAIQQFYYLPGLSSSTQK